MPIKHLFLLCCVFMRVHSYEALFGGSMVVWSEVDILGLIAIPFCVVHELQSVVTL